MIKKIIYRLQLVRFNRVCYDTRKEMSIARFKQMTIEILKVWGTMKFNTGYIRRHL